jgi:hypothetical protein
VCERERDTSYVCVHVCEYARIIHACICLKVISANVFDHIGLAVKKRHFPQEGRIIAHMAVVVVRPQLTCPSWWLGHNSHVRRGGSQDGDSFEAGARAEREQELMTRVRHDLNEMEGFMHEGRGRGHGDRGEERRARHHSARDDGSSFIPKAWRKGLKEDVRQVGDRLVPVTGHPVNLDLI